MSESNVSAALDTPSALQSASWHPVDDWSILTGHDVEIYIGGKVVDRGRVDDVMADGSILWLKHEGATSRRIIENALGTYVRLSASCTLAGPQQRSR